MCKKPELEESKSASRELTDAHPVRVEPEIIFQCPPHRKSDRDPTPGKAAVIRRVNASAKMLPLIAVILLCGTVRHLEATCPVTGSHKAAPSPEPDLHDCPLYSKNACCTANIKDKVNTSPEAVSWNQCGRLSTKCEQFFNQLSCFYRCSPDVTIWASPRHSNSLLNVPLCQGFCDQWYKACENDQTCVRDWNADLKRSNRTWGICTSDCIPFSKMYKNGKDLCETISGSSFKVRSCNCLNMDENDEEVIKTLMQEDSTKAGINGELPCKEKRSTRNKLRRSIRTHSLFVEDIDGSGSGFPTTD
ncbi:riboflavin-binding protein-like [Hemiscyllium ocellatum]|uniref:riboflavin-binding protein-like n=1 Tax=Hemiscyllium ocellatum TaxID=170820 RepID=UPI002965F360|nr:riboflavin-binding protein-like [Hemiscyllium ocellatum]